MLASRVFWRPSGVRAGSCILIGTSLVISILLVSSGRGPRVPMSLDGPGHVCIVPRGS